MIQRIQSIFLILSVIAQILFISLPLSHFIMENNDAMDLFARGFKNTSGEILFPTAPVYILSFAIVLLTIVSILLYRRRILQIRVCIYTILLNLGMIGLLIFQMSNFTKNNPVVSNSYDFALVIPLVNIILLYLAFRGIRKDEVLVKAYERLR